MRFFKISSTQPAAKNIAESIIRKLEENKKVLWLSGGGSGVKVAAEASKLLKNAANLKNLTFTLTDERYGPLGHADSNWQQLIDAGFSLPQATLIPVLTGKDIKTTTEDFGRGLEEELKHADYRIGLFGMGADGHTSGILPNSPAVEAKRFAVFYKTPEFERMTMTFNAIKKVDEGILYAVGEAKHTVLNKLEKNVALSEQPAQILKQLNTLNVYNDYKGEDS
jgi:6-phosphogluconolactonase/glucosamine-6-phosphate isomerase/deaminase